MAKQVLDIRAGKGNMSIAQSNEHLRVGSENAFKARLSENYNPTREHLDFEIKEGGVITALNKDDSITARIKRNLKRRGIKMLENRRMYANIIIGGSREQMLKLAFADQVLDVNDKFADHSHIVRKPEIEQWALDMYKFMSNKYGEDNIAAFVVHLDETNPHIHCTLLPITEGNKFSYNSFFGGKKENGRKKFLELHDELAKVNEKYGLERGEDTKITGAKHKTTAQYRAEMSVMMKNDIVSMAEQIARWREQIGQMSEESVMLASEISKKKEKKTQLEREIIHATARVKALNTMMDNLLKRQNELKDELLKLRRDIALGRVTQEEYEKKIAILQKEMQDCEESISDKLTKLKEAQCKLDDLQNSINSKQEKLSDVKSTLRNEKANLNRAAFMKGQALLYTASTLNIQSKMQDYKRTVASLSHEQRLFIDRIVNNTLLSGNSAILEMADDGIQVAQIATNLFLGYIDNATAVSQSCGGGGGPTDGWGKRDDEDEYAFWSRCFSMARQMRRSGQNRSRER